MTAEPVWDPRSPDVLENQVAAYDEMRGRCPVAHDETLGWSLFRHADVLRVALDHGTFSNQVSSHLQVPNGMDPPEHTAFRAVVDRYFGPDVVEPFEASCRAIAADLVDHLPLNTRVDAMTSLAEPFALRVQSDYLGWPHRLERPLRAWTARNRAATLARNPQASAALAEEFDGYIGELLSERRALGADAPDDLTTRLLGERVDGRALSDEELVSILRNWTVGELGTIAACVGIVVRLLAARPDVQDTLRRYPATIGEAVDEMLRIEPPFVASRRVVTRSTTLAGRRFEPGDRVTALWASADRDADVFGDPDEFRLGRPAHDNLLYGAGIHVCPGAPLARLELRVIVEELLAATSRIEPWPDEPPARAAYPAGGFTDVPVRLTAPTPPPGKVPAPAHRGADDE
jgi:cytochrome P450